jgi:hypothetical protein
MFNTEGNPQQHVGSLLMSGVAHSVATSVKLRIPLAQKHNVHNQRLAPLNDVPDLMGAIS